MTSHPTMTSRARTTLAGGLTGAVAMAGALAGALALSDPAVAAENLIISGVVVDHDGMPLSGIRAQTRYSPSHDITDADGKFSFISDATTTQLAFLGPNDQIESSQTTGWMMVFSKQVDITDDTDLGTLTFPQMRPISVAVVDLDGDPVPNPWFNEMGGSLSPGDNWAPQDHPLSATLPITDGFYQLHVNAGPVGHVDLHVPTQPGNVLPSAPVTYLDGGSVYTADLTDAKPTGTLTDTGAEQYTLTITGLDVPSIQVPGAPGKPVVTIGDQRLRVTWTPAEDGGTAITSYEVTATGDGGERTCQTAGASALRSCTVTGLTNGVAYVLSVRATNRVGTGDASQPSEPVTPAGKPLRLPKPDLKALAHRGAGAKTFVLTWVAANGNGAAITGYRVVVDGKAKTVGASSQRLALKFKPGRHQVTVAAINIIGVAPPSPAATVRVP